MLDDGPQPFTLLGEKIVLWKRADGTPAAMRDRCCHRTAKLSRVSSTATTSSAATTAGPTTAPALRAHPAARRRRHPAGAKVPSYHCVEKYGYAWVALEDPLRPIPEFAEEASGRHRRILQFYQRGRRARCA
jgi:phenylpropionate dioxygenase-like ring-hydroxylating dioxygenase large terminal subunit